LGNARGDNVPGRNGSSKDRPLGRGRRAKALGDVLVDAVSRAADGGFITDADGRIILWNGAAEAILGYARDDVLGRRCCDLFRGDGLDGDTPRPDCANRSHRQRVEPTPTFDLHTWTKAGVTICVNVSILLLRLGGRDAPLVLHLFRDVTCSRSPAPLAEARLAADSPGHTNGALTYRECEVLSLIGEGLNTSAIAERLHLSWATVRNHAQNILLKLNVHSRLEAVAYARRHRLL
jgi:PAS domain S-box-containing protein